ncbi:MAG: DNA polymerase Y family protein [Acidimicrobiales bacterium]
MSATRMVVVWCPDWPVVAWGVPLDEPAVVITGNRVVACSPAARAEGVARGQRRRDAQARCPDLAVLDRAPEREARLFEPVITALETLTPAIEVTGPGLAGFPTRGPSRFFGGDEALTVTVVAEVGRVLGSRGALRVGVADGVFAARLAARSRRADPVHIVELGDSPRFLADLPITTLDQPELTGVLGRLGLTTLGAFAALPAASVTGRFGREGREAHRLARGDDRFPPDLQRPAPDLAATWLFDPPVERVEGCALATRMLADELHTGLAERGLACLRVMIETESEHGETRMRLWRHEGALSATAMADRARWQLDGWLTQPTGRPTAGITRLTLVPDEVVAATGRQLGFWSGHDQRADDATRTVARLQALLGSDAVSVPVPRGGVSPAERVGLVPAASVDLEDRSTSGMVWPTEPWPGMIPAPAPAQVFTDPLPVEIVDAAGQVVSVSGRGELSAPPVAIRSPGAARSRPIAAWAGPWPADQRWWDPLTHRRRARMQIVLDHGVAHLVAVEHRSWSIEASYG